MLQIALDCIRRGWHVFPCWPESKKPMTAHGWKDASNDEAQVRAWWEKTPNANVAIACNPSNLCVLDIDHGLAGVDDLEAWLGAAYIGVSYAVRTGRRPEFGAQVYFSGAVPDVGLWRLNGCEGQIKSLGGYVMAAGCIHPDSKQPYEVVWDNPLAPTPPEVRALKKPETPGKADDGGPITANRNVTLTSIAGKLRNAGLSREAIEAALLQVNADRCAPPLEEEEVQQIAKHAAEWRVPEPEPVAVIGTGKSTEPQAPRDWRALFHTKEEMENAPPISFLIQNFLQREGVTALAAPVRERKSLIALNVVHALLTGEKLFDYFEVVQKPERVLYLVPEVFIGPFTDRLKKIGLIDYVGERLFVRTGTHPEGTLSLSDPDLLPALPGSVVILDTAIRFLEGDENASQDVRKFADMIFALLRNGAEAILILHHSPKDAGDTMTLENAMRGSGDMGAFLACCWGTRLQDPAKPYESPSFLSNLKQRDFESKDFEVTGDASNCRLRIVADPDAEAVILKPRRAGNTRNKDGKEDAALAILKAHPKLPLRKTCEMLKEHGIKRGKDWVREKRNEIIQATGGTMP